MILLAFETASPSGGVALLRDDEVLGELRVYGSQSHSRLCLEFAETLLAGARLTWRDLTHVAASRGPGSFTGVRVGLTLAKGIAFAQGIPTCSVDTLEALALEGYGGEPITHVVPLIDARIGEVYGAVFRVESGMLVRERENFCLTPTELEAFLPPHALYAGEGSRRYWKDRFSTRGILARPDRIHCSPAAVAVLGARQAARGDTMTAQELDAVYLRDAVQPRVVSKERH